MKKLLLVVICFLSVIGIVSLCVESPFPSDMTESIISDEEWAKYEENSKVNIDETFTGTIDEVIDEYIVKYEEDDDIDEFQTVVHHTFNTKEEENKIISYIVYDYRGGCFINGIFTEGGGSADIPTVITLEKVKNKKDEYKVISFITAQDGEGYGDSIGKIFPINVEIKYMLGMYHKKIEKKLLKSKQDYLKKIGRKAEIQEYVETKYLLDGTYYDSEKITEAQSDKMYDLIEKFEWKDYPDWIGNREVVKKGKRYIYEASRKKIGKWKFIITYTKTNENGKVLEKYKVKLDKSDYKISKII